LTLPPSRYARPVTEPVEVPAHGTTGLPLMPHVYILECADGTFYTGSTLDIDRRLWEHDQGVGARYTRSRLPVRIVFAQEFDRMDEAFAREKQIQGWSRAKKLALIRGEYGILPDLARCAALRQAQ